MVNYRGPDVVKHFVHKIRSETIAIYDILKQSNEVIFAEEDKLNFESTDICHICSRKVKTELEEIKDLDNLVISKEKKLDGNIKIMSMKVGKTNDEIKVIKKNNKYYRADNLKNQKVWDHCLLTGKYKGVAHVKCTLNFKYRKYIPVIFRNMSGYDSHLFETEFGDKKGKLNCIPNTDQQYISFSHDIIVDKKEQIVNNESIQKEIKMKLRIVDAFKFIPMSFEKLARNITVYDLVNLLKYYDNIENVKLLKKKQIYPYDYVDCNDKFNEIEIPLKKKFYNKQNNEAITTKSYLHAKDVWNSFECKSLGEYHDLYLKTDVLILADVFEIYRRFCMYDNVIKFRNYNNQLKLPFVIYADFEAFNKSIPTHVPDPEKKSYTINYQKQEANSYCYYIHCIDSKHSKLVHYRGPDAGKHFVNAISEDTKAIYKVLADEHEMIFTENDSLKYESTKNCHICNKYIPDEKKVRDHCHLTGKFRGAAHDACNLNFKYRNFIPVFFHNLSGYDSHLFIKEFGDIEGNFDCIPNTDEKYISFSHDIIVDRIVEVINGKERRKTIKTKLRFLDSFKFMSTSLEKLVNNLNDEDLVNLKKYFEDEKINLVKKKGIYPYDYVNCEDKFNETKLPSKESFYNRLKGEDVTTEEYLHAKEVWKAFECKNFGEYHDIYLKTDVLLLADVFEKFRSICMNTYKLDPSHYFTAPGLSWDALLKCSDVKLELLSDPDMILFIEDGIRGGISMISNKYAKANNIYMKDFNKELVSKYIMYFDANNLYGWAMSQYLPTSDFKWLTNFEKFDVMSIPDDNKKGYILEVDLEYPLELHDLHSDYPLVAEKLEIKEEWLSTYSKSIKPDKNTAKVKKLVPNLQNKQKYKIHYRNLKQCIILGMKLTKIHRIMEFTQSSWMKKYIDLNTDMRKKAKNEFEKDFFKLMNNSVFGKTMENIRNRVNIKLLKEEDTAKRYVNKPYFKTYKIFSENLIAVHMRRISLKFDKPIYVGMSILELSKTLMYNFHYDIIKKKYGNNAKLLFTDTDSLCYEITTDDIYMDMLEDKHLYDLSDYAEDHALFDTTNKKVIGKMKDEAHGKIITEFVGLRSKMYSLEVPDAEKDEDKHKKTAKGIKKNTVKKTLTIENYKDALFNEENVYRTMNNIRSINHDLYCQEINKLALSSYDDKRYVLNDKINTLAYDHYSILK